MGELGPQYGREGGAQDQSLDLILPPSVDIGDLEDVEAVQNAMRELTDGPGAHVDVVAVCEDEELQCDTVELEGRSARLSFQCGSIHSMLCLFIKHVDKFCSLEVEVVDSAEQYRLLNMSNRRSTATIDGDEALLPLELEEGWNYLCLNLEDVVAAAFGSQYLTTTRVTINGSCSVARVYFQDRHYTVMDLPDCIRSALRA